MSQTDNVPTQQPLDRAPYCGARGALKPLWFLLRRVEFTTLTDPVLFAVAALERDLRAFLESLRLAGAPAFAQSPQLGRSVERAACQFQGSLLQAGCEIFGRHPARLSRHLGKELVEARRALAVFATSLGIDLCGVCPEELDLLAATQPMRKAVSTTLDGFRTDFDRETYGRHLELVTQLETELAVVEAVIGALAHDSSPVALEHARHWTRQVVTSLELIRVSRLCRGRRWAPLRLPARQLERAARAWLERGRSRKRSVVC